MKVYVYSHIDFDNLFKGQVLPQNSAFISICDVDNASAHALTGNNVLNVEFNDSSENEPNHLTEGTASRIIDFIEANLGKDFYIHCTAGRSRSQGVCRAITDLYDGQWETNPNNPCLTPNQHVVCTLKHIVYSRYYN